MMEIERKLRVALESTGTHWARDTGLTALDALRSEPQADVLAALDRCIAECRHRLTVADILGRLPDRGLAPPVAWAVAIDACLWDAHRTRVIPLAVWRAWPRELYLSGDTIGARRAFEARYAEVRQACHGCTHVELGRDAGEIYRTLQDAVADGRLSEAEARAAYPAIDDGPPSPAPRLPRPRRGIPPHVRAALDRLQAGGAIVGRDGDTGPPIHQTAARRAWWARYLADQAGE